MLAHVLLDRGEKDVRVAVVHEGNEVSLAAHLGERPPPATHFSHAGSASHGFRTNWQRGYSGTSTRALASAMEVSSSSLYAAFGTKSGLFGEAVRGYALRYSAIYDRAIAEPAVMGVINRLLRESVIEFTRSDEGHPGCLTTSAVMSDSSPTFDARSFAAELERVDEVRLLVRLNIAPADECPEGVEPKELAELTQVLWQGPSTRAELGAGRGELLRAAASAVGLISGR